MLIIEVASPLRADDRYEFACHVRRRRSLRRRIFRSAGTADAPRRGIPDLVGFGFRTRGWPIDHHPVWDAFYPLMYLTRYGGPLFGTRHRQARIRIAYPIHPLIGEFFTRRASDLGLEVTVEAKASGATFDGPASDHVLAFGGGKESRAILGMLREGAGHALVVSSWSHHAPDLPDALISDPGSAALVDRMMPAFMRRGRHLYLGGTLGGSHRVRPWHRYFDVSSPAPLREVAALLSSLGLPTEVHSPLAIAPPNVGQWVLHDRYPDLFRHQHSTRDGHPSEKNLHVALCRHHHGIPYERQCPPELFARLLGRFVSRELANPSDFGDRREREVISREMRAIIHRHRGDPPFADVRDRIPDDWAGDWIDHLHPYVEPHPIPVFADILGRYATPLDAAPRDARLWRVPT